MKTLIILALLLGACGPSYTIVEQMPGPQGSPGPMGSPGPQGPQGPQGNPGSSCTTEQTSTGAVITCTDGSTSIITNGAQGTPGITGQNGTSCTTEQTSTGATITCPNGSVTTITNGTNGTNGTNATPIVAEQFCKNYTANYPSVFPEFGLLINGSLYAVYWDGKNAWLSVIPPGYYASTSTSAPCDFTVNTNGSITDN